MVRVFSGYLTRRRESSSENGSLRGARARRALALCVVLGLGAGCAIVPRSQMDECKQVAHTLRSENARMKDQIVALQNQNRDYADRAVDDARRLAVQDEAVEHLQQSVQAYQSERAQLESAYNQLATALGEPELVEKRLSSRQPAGRPAKAPGKASSAKDQKTARKGDDDARQ